MNNSQKQVEGICLVLCQPSPFLLVPQRLFFLLLKKERKRLYVGETDGRRGETECLIPDPTLPELVVAMEIRWLSPGRLKQYNLHLQYMHVSVLP